MDKLKGLFVEDWKRSWTWLTMWLSGALFFIDSAKDELPFIHDYLPDGWVKYIALAIFAARLINQKGWRKRSDRDPN